MSTSRRIEGFMECKRRVVSAIDYRIKELYAAIEVMVRNNGDVDWYAYRIDELESLRKYVKGMVVKNDKQSSRKN